MDKSKTSGYTGKKKLTDEWNSHGVKQGVEYAILTDEITKGGQE